MKIGIVGPEEKKFTIDGKAECLKNIRSILAESLLAGENPVVVSGHCPLGGVDIYAEDVAAELGLDTDIKAPKQLTWDAEYGYKQRNLDIAKDSDILYVFTVDRLPEIFKGMTFDLCYHCGTKDHVKGGGCWTGKQAQKLGKTVKWINIQN